jgi:endonuclease III
MKAVVETLRRTYGGPATLDEPRPLEQVILLILSRGSDIRKAQAAMRQLQAVYVDWNEVRVTSAYELRKHLHGLGEAKPGDKADQLKDLLSTVYNRFNKLNLDFMDRGASDPDTARKRDRFQNYLQEKVPAVAAMMTLYGQPAGELVVQPSLPRLLGRLGWLNGKSTGVAASREAITKLFAEEDLFGVQWGLYHVLEEHCHGRSPTCPECPLMKHCPAGKEGVKDKVDAPEPKRKKGAEARGSGSKARAAR